MDVVLGEMARRSLIPVATRLSPLDGADLVHGEARYVVTDDDDLRFSEVFTFGADVR